jgi:phage tail-like protein
MAVARERPYAQHQFLVDLGDGTTEGADAGFAEVDALSQWVDVIEYRNGNERENSVRKLVGLNHVGNLTLRRGLMGSLRLYQWINEVRNGNGGLRTVTLHLQNEDLSGIVTTWKLIRARPVRYTTGPLKARGCDVAVEELVLAFERLEME